MEALIQGKVSAHLETISGDKSKKGLDRTLIGFGQDYEVRYWCNVLGCTLSQLRAAVRAVGNSADAVKMYLKKK